MTNQHNEFPNRDGRTENAIDGSLMLHSDFSKLFERFKFSRVCINPFVSTGPLQKMRIDPRLSFNIKALQPGRYCSDPIVRQILRESPSQFGYLYHK